MNEGDSSIDMFLLINIFKKRKADQELKQLYSYFLAAWKFFLSLSNWWCEGSAALATVVFGE